VLAEAFGMRKLGPGVYEMRVPADALRDSRTVQLVPGLLGRSQPERLRPTDLACILDSLPRWGISWTHD
jgi:hypothetical protein